MNVRPQLVARIALFSALIYVLSWGTSYLPNINLIFFIVFSAGLMWGVVPGVLVGAVGMGLWTLFNPYGPAPAPVAVAQIVGAAGSGIVGAAFGARAWRECTKKKLTLQLMAAAALCTLAFYLPVNIIDAVVFQPFWPRFVTGALWGVISLGFNLVIFPLLFTVTRHLYLRENTLLWRSN
jgi:uncharacterized membrane protein